MEKLKEIQANIKAPKNLLNKFGGYNYRNAEGIFKAVKPLLNKLGMTLTVNDEIIAVGERVYVKATATLKDLESGKEISTSAYARELLTKKGMDDSQITGSASSYARKYALNGLFLLDDVKDADSVEKEDDEKTKKGRNYKYMKVLEIINGTGITYETTKEWIAKMFGKEIHPNDMTDDQFNGFTNALYRKIDKLMEQ